MSQWGKRFPNYGSTAQYDSSRQDWVDIDIGPSSSDHDVEHYQSSIGRSVGIRHTSQATKDFKSRCDQLSHAVQSIARNTSHMERLVRQIGTSSGAPELRRRLGSLRSSVKEELADTAQTLKSLEETAREPGHRSERRRLEGLRSEYYDAAKRYQNVLKDVIAAQRCSVPSLSIQDHTPRKGERSHVLCEETRGVLEAHRHEAEMEQLLEQEDTIEHHLTLIEEREQTIKQIEADILEVTQIFMDLQISERNQMDVVKVNITPTELTVEKRKEELELAVKQQKMAQIKLGILIVVIITSIILAAVIATIISVEVSKQ